MKTDDSITVQSKEVKPCQHKSYLQRLKGHPGVPIATALCIMGFVAGASNPSMSWLYGGIFGMSIMGLFWIPVLITARTQP